MIHVTTPSPEYLRVIDQEGFRKRQRRERRERWEGCDEEVATTESDCGLWRMRQPNRVGGEEGSRAREG